MGIKSSKKQLRQRITELEKEIQSRKKYEVGLIEETFDEGLKFAELEDTNKSLEFELKSLNKHISFFKKRDKKQKQKINQLKQNLQIAETEKRKLNEIIWKLQQ